MLEFALDDVIDKLCGYVFVNDTRNAGPGGEKSPRTDALVTERVTKARDSEPTTAERTLSLC